MSETFGLHRSERRSSHRFLATVPASIQIDDQQFTAKLTNVVHGGAMLETATFLEVGAKAIIHCGTLAAEAIVLWENCGRVGVRFMTPLTDAELDEQLSRTAALTGRRRSKIHLRD